MNAAQAALNRSIVRLGALNFTRPTYIYELRVVLRPAVIGG
jgi:hypothetical protein